MSVTRCWFTKTKNLFVKRKDQLIVRLNTYRLLNVGLQRQAISFKGKDQTIARLNTCRLLNVGSQRQAIYFFK